MASQKPQTRIQRIHALRSPCSHFYIPLRRSELPTGRARSNDIVTIPYTRLRPPNQPRPFDLLRQRRERGVIDTFESAVELAFGFNFQEMAELESSNLLRVETTARGDENDDEITITTSPLRPDLLIPQPTPPLLSAWRSLPPLVEVRNTEERGLGLFALQDIEPGTLLIFEEPLLVVPRDIWSWEPRSSFLRHFQKDPLNKLVRGMNNEDWERFKALCRTKRESTESTNRAILFSNGFRMPDDAGTAVFDVGSRANHSCVSNSVFAVVRAGEQGEGEKGEKGEKGWRLMIYNTFTLMEGEEVTVDYGHSRVGLERGYGFVCSCGGCSEGESDDEEDTEELGVERKKGKWRKLKGFLKRVIGKK